MTQDEWLSGDEPLEMVYHTADLPGAGRRLTLFCCAVGRLKGLGRNYKIAQAERWADGGEAPRCKTGFLTNITWAEFSPQQNAFAVSHLDWGDRIGRAVSPAEKADAMRDIFGNPFSAAKAGPITPDVKLLADAAYRKRGKGGLLSRHTLLALSDAMEEAGWEERVLAHLRENPHFLGCWAVDLARGIL